MTEQLTLQSLVRSFQSWGRRRAVGLRSEYGSRWWSYERLATNCCQAAHILREYNFEPQSRIVIWAGNCPEWLAFFYGCALRGLIAVPVDINWPVEQVAATAARFEARAIVSARVINSASIQLPQISLYSVAPETHLCSVDELAVPIQQDDPAVILLTSGSSTEPRGVVLSHSNLMSQATHFSYWKRLSRFAPVRLLALSPLSHIQGLMIGGVVALSLGLSVIYSNSVAPQHLIRTIHDDRVFVLSTVPRLLALLEQALLPNDRRRARPRFLRTAGRTIGVRRALGWQFLILLIGGATLPKRSETFWRDACCFLVQGYGSTETAAFATVNRPFVGTFGSIGKAVHQDSVKLADDGEILVRGPHVATGYCDGKIQSFERTADGFLSTGDLAVTDRSNRLFFLGRKAELIVTGEGYNVHPNAVESILREVEGVRDCVVLGIESNGFEEVHAVFLMAEEKPAADAVRIANARLLPFQRIPSWSVWSQPDFPRLVLGKIDRAAVRADLVQNESAAVPDTIQRKLISSEDLRLELDHSFRMEKLFRYLIGEGSRRDASCEMELVKDLGLQSLDIVRLLSRLESERNVLVAPSRLGEAATVADLQHAICEATAGRNGQVAPSTRWYHTLAWNPVRRLIRNTLVNPYARLRGQIKAFNHSVLTKLDGPVIFAIHQHSRRHYMDYLALYRSVPSRLSKKMFLGTELLGSDSREPLWGGTYINPTTVTQLFFPYVPIPRFGLTRNGLFQACKWIDLGYSAILTWRPGAALIAEQTQTTIVPVHFDSSFFDSNRKHQPNISVTFWCSNLDFTRLSSHTRLLPG
jgi:long-chain acyl-CoA synthetase